MSDTSCRKMLNKHFFLLKFALLPLILYSSACNNIPEKRNIKAYYFPLEDLKEGKIYEYQAVGTDSLAPFFWHFKTIEEAGVTYLTSQYLDHNLTVQQFTKEEVVNNGTLLTDFFLYAKDTITEEPIQNPVSIEANNVFPFEVSDSTSTFLFKLYWTDYLNPKQKIRLIRNRHFMGDATYSFRGKEVDCIRFFTKELLEVEEEGFQELQYNGTELYAKNIGLIYFKKEIAENIVQEYELVDIRSDE